MARTLPDRSWAPEASSRGLVMHRGVVVGRASDADPDGRDLIEIIPGASGGSEDAARERWANPIEARETCAHPHPRLRSPRYERPVLNAAGHGPGPIVRSGVRSSSRFRFRAVLGAFRGPPERSEKCEKCMIPHCDPVQFQRRILAARGVAPSHEHRQHKYRIAHCWGPCAVLRSDLGNSEYSCRAILNRLLDLLAVNLFGFEVLPPKMDRTHAHPHVSESVKRGATEY